MLLTKGAVAILQCSFFERNFKDLSAILYVQKRAGKTPALFVIC